MEASSLQPAGTVPWLRVRAPRRALWLYSDERLVDYVRAGSDGAFEVLFRRYYAHLFVYCTQLLRRSGSDPEDVVQETFIAALNAMRADAREIDVTPWLYTIARNRCINQQRSITSRRDAGLDQDASDDSIAASPADNGASADERFGRQEEFLLVVGDIGELPETQRSALVLREWCGLSCGQVADVMGTSLPSVNALLNRARASLGESREARDVTCDVARHVLVEQAEGLGGGMPAPITSHVKRCEDCRAFKGHLKKTNRLVASISPVGPLLTLKTLLLTKLGVGAGGGAGTTGGAGVATAVGATTGAGVAAKTVAGVATVAALIAGAADVERGVRDHGGAGAGAATVAPRGADSHGPAPVAGEGADGVRPAPTTAGDESSDAPEPLADIQSSTPEPAVPQSAPGRPAEPQESIRRAPGSSVRGRPVPGLDGIRRTRPGPQSDEGPPTLTHPPAAPAVPVPTPPQATLPPPSPPVVTHEDPLPPAPQDPSSGAD